LRLKAYENFGFYTGAVSIAGVSVGLPGSGRAVFSDDHFESLIEGQNFIEALGQEEKEAMFQRKIRRLHKTPEGNARFVDIASTDEVIHLAGKLGFFDPEGEYGLEKGQDISIALAMAAGLEALKDARIPLLEGQSRAGSRLAGEELALPASMQETTGVIFTGLFPGWETLIHEMEAFQQHRYQDGPGRALESLYYDLMETLSDRSLKERVAGWFHAIRPLWEKKEPYRFDSTFLDKITPLASAHFAKLIRARGPNVHLSGACASTTQAIAVAEDWIRSGRCERVVVIGSETATASGQGPWISAGFLSLGAASIEKEISRAAKPFDADRNGTLLGAGATALVVERRDLLRARGLEGQAEILGTFLANAAFHTTRIDVPYLAGTMARFVRQVETRHGLDPESYASRMVFMSHETFTPARGGSADAEIEALRAAYGRDAGKITITNTKGLTGHTLGAAIEDAVMVKALQRGQTPPVAHLKKVPEHFSDLKFSRGEKGDFQYGLHFSAGFGSHFALLMVKRTEERATENNAAYEAWLSAISGMEKPGLRMKNRVLVLATAPGFSGESLPAGVGEKAPAPPVKAKTVKAEPKVSSRVKILEEIRNILSEQTGYGTDMLAEDLDLEADLGIDTVKQVEIFSKVMGHFGLGAEEDAPLRELSTLGKIADYIAVQSGAVSLNVREKASTAGASGREAILTAIRDILSEQTGYGTDMLAEDLDLEADLGIDTVKQVEIFSKVMGHFGLGAEEDAPLRELSTLGKIADYIAAQSGALPLEEKEETAISSAGASGREAILTAIRDILSEQTGYGTDMLAEALDLEADLGIDTVKQVEIFSKVMGHFGLGAEEDAPLRELSTLGKIADYIAAQKGASAPEEDGRQTDPIAESPGSEDESSLLPADPGHSEKGLFRFVPDVRKAPAEAGPR
ncbi:phosphopantetheine-binding protein, partial [Desulfobotulus sp.]|uniref:phosphopantetheine-binding protein n=1 Tax=Desulfobotulus sp. TaxID=1940337 RepID=UPI002A363727